MSRPLLLVVSLASLLGGCVYFNSLYNAQRIFEKAEEDRRAGHDASADARYDSVVTKAADSYRKDPDGSWADDALYLLGRAYLRQGRLARARAALERTLEITEDHAVWSGARLYLGVVTGLAGDHDRGVRLVDEALPGVRSDRLRGEAFLWRGRILLAAERVAEARADLERATRVDPDLGVAADLERVAWGIAHDDTTGVREGFGRLLRSDAAYLIADTLHALSRTAAEAWGAGSAAHLLTPVDRAPWPPPRRGDLLLLRATLRIRAGDTAAGVEDARSVSDGVGPEAIRARLMLARLRLASAEDVEDLDEARSVLLPAVGDLEVLEILEAVRKVEVLERKAERDGRVVALFAAGEMARDALGARALARALLLRYADRARGPWTGKALMAALDLTDDDDARRGLRRRLDAMESNPYARAARMGWVGAARFRELETALRDEMEDVLSEATAEVVQLDVFVRERSDTIP